MKKIFLVFTFFIAGISLAQQNEIKPFFIEAEAFYGSIIEHNNEEAHLIREHPKGFILSYNRKTYGFNDWEGLYNYPDWGFTFAYQDMRTTTLGENYGLYGHFTWYFFNRHLSVGVGQGIAYNTNPYDPETNFKNNAYGSRLLSSTFLRVNFVKENLFKGFGVTAGMGILHYSNANFKAPNNSTNTFYLSTGIRYEYDHQSFPTLIPSDNWSSKFYAERIHYNAVFRTGLNEADVNGLGQHPFYTFSVFADKRLNYKSSIQVGVDVFFSLFLIDFIRYRAVVFPEDQLTGNEDYRRIGVFIGHEFRFTQLAFVSQVGYYVYWPYPFENRVYNRLGLKRYFFNDRFFGAVTLKAHYAKAEAVEFGIGIRL